MTRPADPAIPRTRAPGGGDIESQAYEMVNEERSFPSVQ